MKAGLGRADHVKLVPSVEQGQHAKCKMVIFKINLLQQQPPGRELQISSEQPTQCLNIIIHPLEQISTASLSGKQFQFSKLSSNLKLFVRKLVCSIDPESCASVAKNNT